MPSRRVLLAAAVAVLCVAGAAWTGAAWRQENRLNEAGSALAAGRSADATRLAGSATGRSVAPRAASLRAAAAVQSGDLPTAARALADAIRTAPNDWTLRRDHAIVLRRLGRTSAARREMSRALQLNPRLVLPPGFS